MQRHALAQFALALDAPTSGRLVLLEWEDRLPERVLVTVTTAPAWTDAASVVIEDETAGAAGAFADPLATAVGSPIAGPAGGAFATERRQLNFTEAGTVSRLRVRPGSVNAGERVLVEIVGFFATGA